MRPQSKSTPDLPDVPRIYTIWPASQKDLPAVTSGPWNQERRWLVLDVTDGVAASYIVEGPIEHAEAIHRAAEIQTVARAGARRSLENGAEWQIDEETAVQPSKHAYPVDTQRDHG